jgi:L-threonylcarbamoyladenylate synthase
MQKQILQAVETLKNGGVILLPTETVYGIAVDARNKSAVEKIYEIKNRDYSKPLQIMVSSVEEAKKIAEFNNKAQELAKKYWPGALTIILKLKPDYLANNFNKMNDTVGIRIPNHSLALEILRAFNSPLAVTSANISGKGDNISFAEAKTSLGDKLDLLIDGGSSDIGISSTVIDLTDETNPKILRQGSVIIG